MEPTNEALLLAWREGDQESGTRLFRRLFPQCRRFFANKVPERDVDDLLQRTFTGMVESRDRFRGDASLRTFMFAIARNVLLHYLRDFARKGSKQDPDFHLSSIAMLGLSPGSVLAHEQEHERVRRALQEIPVHFQTVIELSYWEELSHAQLAEVLEVEPTTVRTRLFRARKALAGVLKREVDEAEGPLDHALRDLGSKI